MVKNSKQTSRRVASTASKILRDGRYGKDSKSVAPVHWHRQNHVERNNFHNLDRQRMIGQSACLSPCREKIKYVRF